MTLLTQQAPGTTDRSNRRSFVFPVTSENY
jgi:hypothetical protein